MKKLIKHLTITAVCCLFSANIALAEDQNSTATQTKADTTSKPQPAPAAPSFIPTAPNIDAKAYVLMDANSGTVLAQKNMNEKLPPASLTKLMTLYVVSQAIRDGRIKLDDEVRISKNAWQTGGSRMFVKLGSRVKLQDLIEGVIVASGNDACVALAEYVAGSEDSFAQLMNENARQIGMKDSHYVDSTGLPHQDHYATAYDLALLARAIVEDFPEDYQWYRQKWITYNGIKQPNRNRLLWRDPSVDGLKTGHTQAAGYCLISSAKRDNMRLISVVMGTPSDNSRTNDSQALLNWGYHFFESYEIVPAGKVLASPRTWLAKDKYTQLGVSKDFYVAVPNKQYKNLKASIDLPKKLEAPLVKGQQVGKVQVTLSGKVIAERALVVLDDNPRGGIFSRMYDHVAMLFSGWFS